MHPPGWRNTMFNPDATIYEQSWSMPSYNAVLTLLWVADDIEGDDQ